VAEHIEIDLPASPQSLSFVRLNVGAIAARMDMTIDELEDLQLAVEELCLMLLRPHGGGGRLEVAVEWEPTLVEVRCRLAGGAQGGAASDGIPTELSLQILGALVDEHGTGELDGSATAWLRKRREQAPTR
jgi:serine/threonine-protein kinase RsbW